MNTPKWLSRADVEAIHETVIEVGGGLHGLRDAALLESALARPRTLYACGEDDDFRLAASYAEGIARNHPFLDGNKRAAFAAADNFLADNGYNLEHARGREHAAMMVQLAQGKTGLEEAARHLRRHSRSLRPDAD